MLGWHGVCLSRRHLVVCAIVQAPASRGFVNAAPLLEEKGNMSPVALVAKRDHPFLLHWPCARTTFTSNDDPIDTPKIQVSEILKKRLDAQEA